MADVTFHDAYLVASYRDEQGTPRQRTISYLGNIRQIGDDFPGIERELFLLRAELIMESLRELSPRDCKEMLKLLYQKVPPLSEDEMMVGFQNTIRWYFRRLREQGCTPSHHDLVQMIERAHEAPDPVLIIGERDG